jgi:hypothetical protein
MRGDWISWLTCDGLLDLAIPEELYEAFGMRPWSWPLPNVWLGTSVEDQPAADTRIPELLACPAAVRFLSVEPLLGPVDLPIYYPPKCDCETCSKTSVLCTASLARLEGLDWVICGGESGSGRRPMEMAWAESLYRQCKDAGVAYFFKQISAMKPGQGHDAIPVHEFPGARLMHGGFPGIPAAWGDEWDLGGEA